MIHQFKRFRQWTISQTQSHRYLPIWLSLFLGIGLSISAAIQVSKWKIANTEVTLERRADNLAVSLQSKIEEYVQVTRALGAFYDADDQIAREDFQAFSQPFLTRYPAILGMAWVKPVSHRDRADFEAAIAAEGFTNFTIKERTPENIFIPAAERPEYFVVTYGEPLKIYRPLIGADWGGDRFDPKFFTTLKQVRDTGQMVPTEKLLLVTNTGGFALFKPVYQRKMPTDTVANRRKYFLGIVYSIYQFSTLIEESIAGLNLENINFYLIDNSVESNNRFLGFYHSQSKEFDASPHPENIINIPTLCKNPDKCRREIAIGDREWSVVILPTPGFYGANWETLSTLAIGFLLTTMLVVYLFLSIRHTEDLRTAMKQLQLTQTQLVQAEKMSSLGQLVAGVAHEINNPVSFIYGNIAHANEYFQDILNLLQLYQKEYPNPSPAIEEKTEEIDLNFIQEDLPKTLGSMQVGAERIQKIVLSLRTFSRMDESDMKFVDIHSGIESTLMILQSRLKGTSERPEIQVIKKYENLPSVECYAGQLNQVFMNILLNGIDALEAAFSKQFTSDSPLAKPKATDDAKITIATTLNQLQESVVIRIRDNGIGMSQEIQKSLFNPFFTTKSVGKGTGLGLSISYQIVVEKHGGLLKCFSEPGQGSEFWIEIPIRQTKSLTTQSIPV